VPDDVDRDEWALLLREQGRSFAGIARVLDLSGALGANAAFNRALRRQTLGEQEALRNREVARLDALAERLRGRDGVTEEELARQLHGLRRLRKTLYVA